MPKRKLRKGSPPPTGSRLAPAGGQGTRLAGRKLTSVNPLKEQFEPTSSSPIRQTAKMAGVE